MTSIESVTLEVADPTAADRFYTAAFGLGTQVRLRASEAPTTGFRGFTLSLTVSQPATVNGLIGAALDAGATPLKPAAKSFWGYGGVVQAPDGTIWKVATSAKKDTGPATRQIDQIVLLLGVADVAASKRFYVDRGLAVAKSFGRKYVEFATPSSPVKLALYGRRALAKDAGVSPDGTGSHRLMIGGDAGPFTDPDGFAWEAATALSRVGATVRSRAMCHPTWTRHSRGAAPARPRAAAPRPGPDRPGVRAAAGRRGARPRRAHVGRAPQPPVPARLRRVAVQLPDDAAHRARDGAAAPGRPQRHRGLLRGRLLVAGHLQHPLHRAGRHAAQRLPAPGGWRDGGDAAVRGETGDQTGQESRSAGHRAAASVTAMDITIHASFLPHDDPDASLAFYRDILGFEVRTDVGQRQDALDHGRPRRPARHVHPPGAAGRRPRHHRRRAPHHRRDDGQGHLRLDPAGHQGPRRHLRAVQASDAEVVQEPTEQPYGIRDCAFRDPAGNLVRIQELR